MRALVVTAAAAGLAGAAWHRTCRIRQGIADEIERLHAAALALAPQHFGGYRSVDGLRVPSEGEVGWHFGGRWCAVWKATLVQALYLR